MKQVHFFCQSKGGVGKSMIIYLHALKYQNDHTVFFLDADSATKTSTRQLAFLHGQTPPRFGTFQLLNEVRGAIDRQLLFSNLQHLATLPQQHFYIDCGSTESNQLPELFKDYTAQEIKHIEKELNMKIIFNVIISGSAYLATCTYLNEVVRMVEELFEVRILLNAFTFQNNLELIEEVKMYSKNHSVNSIKLVADFDTNASPIKNILNKITLGQGLENYVFIERIKILKEINKL